MDHTPQFTGPMSYLVSATFVIGLWVPFATTTYYADEDVSFAEKRTLAPPPEWPPVRADRLFTQIDAYYEDHFGGRDALIRQQRRIALDWLGLPPTEHVALGEDDWLFLSSRFGFETAATLQPFTPAELQGWQSALEDIERYVDEAECRFLFVVAPSKPSVYPEYLPERIRAVRGESRLDQMLQHIRDESSLALVDIQPALRTATADAQVYFRTDTHWNARGAFVASDQITHVLEQWFPDLGPLPSFEYETSRDVMSGDLAGLAGLPSRFTEHRVKVRWRAPRLSSEAEITWLGEVGFEQRQTPFATEMPSPQLPRAVMFHDSFGNALRQFLSNHFERIVYACPAATGVSKEVIEAEKPDVVILLIAERRLYQDVPELF